MPNRPPDKPGKLVERDTMARPEIPVTPQKIYF
jgi:hypothetical protein